MNREGDPVGAHKRGLWLCVVLPATLGACCKGPLYQPPADPTDANVRAQCLSFREAAEGNSTTWSVLGYSLALVGTSLVAGGGAGAAAFDNGYGRAGSAVAAAVGALMLATSKGAFESSWANSSAAAGADRALLDSTPEEVNADCLRADAELRLAKRNEINGAVGAPKQ